MELLFDTANIEEIKKYSKVFPMTGITSNPSILKAEGAVDFFAHMRQIRKIIGYEKSLHVQVVASDCDGMVKEAEAICSNIDDKVYIKVPTNEEGLKAMQIIKSEGIGITATVIYSQIQGLMAILCQADFIAPYYNRMEDLNINSSEVIKALRTLIDEHKGITKILAASFKNISQINKAFLAGAHAVTVQPSLLHLGLSTAQVQKSVDDFTADWIKIHGKNSLINI